MLTKKCLQIHIIYYFHNEEVLGWNLTSSSTINYQITFNNTIYKYLNEFFIYK